MINFAIFVLSLLIFADTISYSIYEFKCKNKFAGFMVSLIAILMVFFVNIIVFNFK